MKIYIDQDILPTDPTVDYLLLQLGSVPGIEISPLYHQFRLGEGDYDSHYTIAFRCSWSLDAVEEALEEIHEKTGVDFMAQEVSHLRWDEEIQHVLSAYDLEVERRSLALDVTFPMHILSMIHEDFEWEESVEVLNFTSRR